jgi:hypothetical protein
MGMSMGERSMEALKIKKHIDSEILNLPVPKTMVGKNVEIILLVETDDIQPIPAKIKREPGSAKGMMTMADDFEKPIGDEYPSAQSKEALQKVRERVRRYVAPDRSLVEELIQDRREESANE